MEVSVSVIPQALFPGEESTATLGIEKCVDPRGGLLKAAFATCCDHMAQCLTSAVTIWHVFCICCDDMAQCLTFAVTAWHSV
jgi:hypothetical protein